MTTTIDSRITEVPQQRDNIARHATYKGVRGWLLFFCISLTIGVPLGLMARAGELLTYGSLSASDRIAIRIFVIALSAPAVFVGIGLWRLAPGAVRNAKAYLWFNLACAMASFIIAALGHITGADIKLLFGSTGYSFIWLWYLNSSKRIKDTYSHKF